MLVIGVGSELRRDDAAGRRVVDLLHGRLPRDRVEVRSVHQLTPELADEATGRELLIVVDAAVDGASVTVRDVQVETTPSAFSHRLDVPALLRLAAVLGTPPTESVTVAVPAHDLAIGTELSPATARDVEVAAEHVVVLCGGRAHYPHPEREDPR